MSGTLLPNLNFNNVLPSNATQDGILEQQNTFNSGSFVVGSGKASSSVSDPLGGSLWANLAYVVIGGLIVAISMKGQK